MSQDIIDEGAALAARQTEELRRLRGAFDAQQADLAAMAAELERLGLPVRTPPTMDQISAAVPADASAQVRKAVADAERALEDIPAGKSTKTKAPRMMRNTI